MAQSGFRINVTFAFVIVPHCKAKSSKGKGNKKFSFNFCGKSEGKGDRTLASRWIFSFWSLLKILRGIILGSFSLDLTHKLSLLLKSHKDDFPDLEIAGFKHSDNHNPPVTGLQTVLTGVWMGSLSFCLLSRDQKFSTGKDASSLEDNPSNLLFES